MIANVIVEAEPAWSAVVQAVAGDEVAFARIVAAHHDDMARIAYVVCGDLDIAAEAEQSAWAVVFRRLKDLRDPARLRPWLMSIAANEARQIARSRRRRTVREISVRDPSSPPVIDQASLIDLAEALGRLDPKDRGDRRPAFPRRIRIGGNRARDGHDGVGSSRSPASPPSAVAKGSEP